MTKQELSDEFNRLRQELISLRNATGFLTDSGQREYMQKFNELMRITNCLAEHEYNEVKNAQKSL